MTDFGVETLEVGQVWRWSIDKFFDDIMLLIEPVPDAWSASGDMIEGAWLVLFLETGEQQILQPIVTAGDWTLL